MSPSSMKILCRYQYDPLDRLIGLAPLERTSTQRFYQESYLATEIEDQTQQTIFRNNDQPLAQRQSMAGVTETTLLVTDQQQSVLKTLTGTNPQQMAYTPYGHHPAESSLSSLLGFNGERRDAITGHYLLGQGNRAYNPVLMRFNSPDNLSPFGEGGINSYAYCGGDPINFYDPTGNIRAFIITNLSHRASVIVKNPLHTIQRSASTIARPGRPTPLLNVLLDAPVSASPRQGSSTSTLISQKPARAAQAQQQASTTDPSTAFKRELKVDVRKYDAYIKENPGTQVTADPKWQTIINKNRKKLARLATNGAPAKKLNTIVSRIDYAEKNIKRNFIRTIEREAKIVRTQ